MKIIALVALSIFAATVNADQWLCVADKSTGFQFKDGKWGQVRFKIDESKFILRKFREDEDGFGKSGPYGVMQLGSDYPLYKCSELTDWGDGMRFFYCDSVNGDFRFSTVSGRFIRSYMGGYWDGKDNNNDTPLIEIGRCSKI